MIIKDVKTKKEMKGKPPSVVIPHTPPQSPTRPRRSTSPYKSCPTSPQTKLNGSRWVSKGSRKGKKSIWNLTESVLFSVVQRPRNRRRPRTKFTWWEPVVPVLQSRPVRPPRCGYRFLLRTRVRMAVLSTETPQTARWTEWPSRGSWRGKWPGSFRRSRRRPQIASKKTLRDQRESKILKTLIKNNWFCIRIFHQIFILRC